MERKKPTYQELESKIKELEHKLLQLKNNQSNIDSVKYKKTEEKLRESEERWQSLAENSLANIMNVDKSGTILFMNRVEKKVSGDAEVIGTTLYEYLPPNHIDLTRNAIEEVFSTGKTVRYQTTVNDLDGNIAGWYEAQVGPIYDNEKIVTATVTSYEITELKQVEEKLRESEASLKEAQILANIGDWEVDLKSGNIKWSEGLYRITKTDFDTKLSMDYIDKEFLHLDDKIIGEQVIEKALLTGVLEPFEFRAFRKDGKEIVLWNKGKVIYNDQGKPIKLIGINQDITETKRIENELLLAKEKAEENEAKYKTLYNNTPVMLHSTDSSGNIISVNDYWLKITGYREEEIIGTKITNYLSKESRKLYVSLINELLEKGELNNVAAKAIKKDGSIIDILVSSKIFFDKSGTPSHTMTNILDITKLKEIGDKQKALTKKLVKAKEKAEEGDRLKSAFLANMSHEIRTPMNSILGFSNLLKKENLSNEEKERYVEFINFNGKRLLNVISDIVDISKIESQQLLMDLKVCNLNKLIDSLYEQYSILPRSDGVSIKIKKELINAKSYIKTDNNRLMQVLSNLIDNALKFTKEGVVEFGYALNKDTLLFHVKDTGIGIDSKNQKLVFERFRQVDNNYLNSSSGTGLGLSIAKGIVTLLDGEIWVESEINKGTTFYFTIPFNRDVKNEKNEDIKKEDYIERNAEITILIAEDEMSNFLYLEELLREYNYSIIHAENGVEAVELFNKQAPIDLVLMDIKMPLMNGFEAARAIRKTDANVPIIVQSAYAMTEEKNKAKAAGCNDYLIKPIQVELFFEIMMKYLKKNTKAGNC